MTNGRRDETVGGATPQALTGGTARPFSRFPRLRSLASFGLVASLVLGVSLEAASQPKAPAGQGAKKPADPKAAKNKKDPKGAPSASATAAPGAPTGTTTFDPTAAPTAVVSSPMPTATALRKAAPPPDPPSDDQIAALGQLQKEIAIYDKDAREFRDAITNVVKHHYEVRRQRVLTSLDREIATESDGLKEARKRAIEELEKFVERYSGPNAHPEHTPDAMFRLAALYEERANSLPPEELNNALKTAIALYKRINREFPQYRERAAIFYYLGHALNNSGRLPEAQQVWRALVCANHFAPPQPDPADPEKDLIARKPQDHGQKYWDAWGNLHQTPIGQAAEKAGKKPGAKAAAKPAAKAAPAKGKKKVGEGADKTNKTAEDEPAGSDDDTSYRVIYENDCQPIPQKTDPGKDPRYIAEIWWQIGEHHFEMGDIKAGPYNFNRAVTAYRLSMSQASDHIKNPVYSVSMYKLAWTYYKQQRYEAAVKQFVELLKQTDELEKATGDSGTDFRKEASDYIAGSLTFLDFTGPGEDEPFILRPDPVLDGNLPPSEQEKRMHIALDRVQDDKLIPQDRKWTFDIYRALAKEYHELGQYGNETQTLEAMLRKYPNHRDAPLIQDELAQVYELRSRVAQPGSPEAVQFAAKALDARSGLADYVTGEDGKLKPWVEANKDDPEAIQRAERLVKNGLKSAAAQHTINARDFYTQARQTTNADDQRTALAKSLDEYRLAEKGWDAYLSQVRNTRDAYESSFWVADSKFNQINIMVALGQPVPPEKYVSARDAAVEVRDSNEDDKYLEPSAQFVVALADLALSEQYKLYSSSNGAQGIKEKTALGLNGEGKDLKVDTSPPPGPVLAAVAARDEYIGRVPPQNDPAKNGQVFQFRSAEFFFLYGQFEEASKRFDQVVKDQCKKTKWAFQAQQDLLTIAQINADQTGDPTKADAAAKAIQDPETSCAITDTDKSVAKERGGATIQTGAYTRAFAAFTKAKDEMKTDGPERQAQWRLAGELYETALKAAPDRQEAPEAAINGAYSYKQVGDYDKAIEMYRLFIDKYGDEKILVNLQKGNEKEQKQYAERIKGLTEAYEALSGAYVLFFNYRAAAETADKIATIERFPQDKRKTAAYNALVLYSNLGDRDKMATARTKYLTFKPSAEEKAEADYIIVDADRKVWDSRGDSDNNKAVRSKAIASLSQYYDQNKKNAAAARFNVNAAYWVAKMLASTNEAKTDEWWHNTIDAFKQYKASPSGAGGKALATPEATMAAEGDFTLLDAKIRKDFDYDTGHHRYKGTIVEVVKKYQEDNKEADKYFKELDRIASLDNAKNEYGSPEFTVAAIARQGSLYDSLRTGFFNTREPALKLFDAKEEALLKKLEGSGNDDYMEKAGLLRESRTQAWRKKRDVELAAADSNMVFKYTVAVVLGRNYNIRSLTVKKALQRLAFFTDMLGDAKMAEYTGPVEKNESLKFKYEPGMFQKTRPGMVVEPEISVAPPPLPVLVK